MSGKLTRENPSFPSYLCWQLLPPFCIPYLTHAVGGESSCAVNMQSIWFVTLPCQGTEMHFSHIFRLTQFLKLSQAASLFPQQETLVGNVIINNK